MTDAKGRVYETAYDGLGRRITRDGPGGFEEYLYDGPHVIAILDDQQAVVSTLSYYPGVDRPHSLMTSAETYYYATDPTGSVSGLAEFTGAASVTHRYRYDVWGKPQGNVTEAVPNPIRFKARWWDEDTGLADFRSRWYDPEIGRFISEDPIGLAGGINVYRFVGNDPVSGWDPSGLNDPDVPGCSGPSGGTFVTVSEPGWPAYTYYEPGCAPSQGPDPCEEPSNGDPRCEEGWILVIALTGAGGFGPGMHGEAGYVVNLRTGYYSTFESGGVSWGAGSGRFVPAPLRPLPAGISVGFEIAVSAGNMFDAVGAGAGEGEVALGAPFGFGLNVPVGSSTSLFTGLGFSATFGSYAGVHYNSFGNLSPAKRIGGASIGGHPNPCGSSFRLVGGC